MIYKFLAAEWIVCLGGIILLLLEAFGNKNRRGAAHFGMAILAIAGAASLLNWGVGRQTLLGTGYILDGSSLFFKELILLITFVALLVSVDYVSEEIKWQGEFYVLVLFICLGMLFLVSAGDLLTIFISLELTSMPLYVLATSQNTTQRSSEAGLKFFLLGALASAMYLFGSAMLYGSLGTIALDEMPARLGMAGGHMPVAAIFGLLMVMGAFAFKIAAAPFHMWAPDVYEGAPTPVTAFLSTGPKVAGVAILMRIVLGTFNTQVFNVRQDWVLVVSVLAVLSMWVGNLVAMHQTNIKRMMAYSGIAHMGYILVGLAAASVKGASAVMFYMFLYALTNLGAWAVVIAFALATHSEEIRDMAGLGRRAPAVGMILMLAFLSLAGLPPLGGFVGKFYLFAAAWESGLKWLAIMGILASVASLYYYLGVLKVVYFEAPLTEEPLRVSPPLRMAFTISGLVIVVLGLFPPMTQWVMQVATTFMAHS